MDENKSKDLYLQSPIRDTRIFDFFHDPSIKEDKSRKQKDYSTTDHTMPSHDEIMNSMISRAEKILEKNNIRRFYFQKDHNRKDNLSKIEVKIPQLNFDDDFFICWNYIKNKSDIKFLSEEFIHGIRKGILKTKELNKIQKESIKIIKSNLETLKDKNFTLLSHKEEPFLATKRNPKMANEDDLKRILKAMLESIEKKENIDNTHLSIDRLNQFIVDKELGIKKIEALNLKIEKLENEITMQGENQKLNFEFKG